MVTNRGKGVLTGQANLLEQRLVNHGRQLACSIAKVGVDIAQRHAQAFLGKEVFHLRRDHEFKWP